MNANLMDMAKAYLSPDLINKFGSQLGETPEATQKGLSSAVPAVMGGFVRQATSDPTGAGIARMLAGTQRNGERPDDATGIINKGQGMLGSLFGDRLPSAVDHVAHSSGLSQKSAGKILALAAPIVGMIVGREASARKLGPGGIATMLAGQKGAVASALGAGGLATLFGGAESMGGIETRVPHIERAGEKVQHRMVTPEGMPAGRRIGMPFILLGVLALLALLMLFGRRKQPLGTTMPEHPKAVPHAEAPRSPQMQTPSPQVQAPAVPPPPTVEQPTPPGAIGGGPSAAVSELNDFFSDTSEPTPKRIALNGVTFDQDSERLTGAGASSLVGIANALKAHPSANVRIDGYTDSTGNDEANKTLSANRANTVRDALVRMGVDANRITTSGEGSGNPVATNDTEEGRAANRRIELVVTSR